MSEIEVVAAPARGAYPSVLKRLRSSVRQREDLIARLLAEGAMLLELGGGGGVLRCYEVIRDPATLVLESLRTASLAQIIERRKGIDAPSAETTRDALSTFRAVARAAAHAHAHGIIHRDIKPSNILFTSDGELRLSDLGIAVRRGARSTAEGWDDIDVGTLGYASPELLRDPSTANTETVDIYELGALLHEFLLGATPHMMHGAETEAELKARIVAGAPRDLTSRESELTETHRRLLDSALSHDPSHRPQSVAELLALL